MADMNFNTPGFQINTGSNNQSVKLTPKNIASAIENIATPATQEEQLDAKMRQKIILKAVDELPYKMRRVIELYEFEDMPLEKIAKKLGVPEGTVKSRLFNARKILAQKLSFLKGE